MAATYNRVVVSGTLPGGEVWSVNPCFTEPAENGGAVTLFSELQTWATNIATATNPGFLDATLHALMSSAVQLTQIRVEALTAAGVLIGAANAGLDDDSPTGNPIRQSFQAALVASLGTGRPGRSYNGRIYWPAMGAGLDSATGRLNTPSAGNVATSTANFLEGIAGAAPAGANLSPVVASRKLDTQTAVTVVRVGDIIDSQRRRRDSLVEAYNSVNLAA